MIVTESFLFDVTITSYSDKNIKSINNQTYGFWVADYPGPASFSTPIANHVYAKIDRFCAEKSDFVWNNTSRVITARLTYGNRLDMHWQLIVHPSFLALSGIKSFPTEQLELDSIIFMGSFKGKQCFDILIDAIQDIKKIKPTVKVTVVSYEKFPTHYEREILEKGLIDTFEIMGYILDDRLGDIVGKRRVGLALYGPGCKFYSDHFRPKMFLAKGLPVIISDTSVISEDVKNHSAGIVIKYRKEELGKAILQLLDNQQLFEICRGNATELAKTVDLQVIFKNAFEQSALLSDLK